MSEVSAEMAGGIPETGGMYRVAIKDVSAWTVGDLSYFDR